MGIVDIQSTSARPGFDIDASVDVRADVGIDACGAVAETDVVAGVGAVGYAADLDGLHGIVSLCAYGWIGCSMGQRMWTD